MQYVDLSDLAGAITLRGSLPVAGAVGLFSGYCSNTGSWSLDFTDGVHAYAVINSGTVPATPATGLVMGDFTDPDAPVLAWVLQSFGGPAGEQGFVPRFDVDPGTGRALLYVAHSALQSSGFTPLDVYDLSNDASAQQASSVLFPGDICSLQPNGTQLLVSSSYATGVAIEEFDVTSPTTPVTSGSATVQAVRRCSASASPPCSRTWMTRAS